MNKLTTLTSAAQILKELELLGVKFESNDKSLKKVKEVSAIIGTKKK